MRQAEERALPVLSRGDVQPLVAWRWPLVLRDPQAPIPFSPGMVLLDDETAVPEESLHLAWRHWLRLFMLFQVLPGMVMLTRKSLADEAAPSLRPSGERDLSARDAELPAAMGAQWLRAIDSAAQEVQPGLTMMARAAAPLPEVGFEWADERGRVQAEAELAWPAARLAVLTEAQADQAAVWRGMGWRVWLATETPPVEADDAQALAWHEAVMQELRRGGVA